MQQRLRARYSIRVFAGVAVSFATGLAVWVVGAVPIAAAADPPASQPVVQSPRMTGPQRAAKAEDLGKKALAAYDAGDYIGAGSLAEEALNLRSDQPDATITYAMLLKDRQPRDSLDMVRKYTSSDRGKRDYRGYEVAGDLYSRSNNPAQAASYYEQALTWAENVTSKRPVKAELQMKLAESLSQRQLCDKALMNAEKAARSLQQTADLQWRLAKVYSKCGKAAESTKAMETATKLIVAEIDGMKRDELKQFNELHLRLVMRDEILKARYKLLQDQLDKLTSEKKLSAETRVAMKRVMVEQAENDRLIKLVRAAGLMQDAIQFDEKRIESYIELSEVEEMMGFRASSVAALLKARAISPGDTRVSEALGRLGAGSAGSVPGGSGSGGAKPSTQPVTTRPSAPVKR